LKRLATMANFNPFAIIFPSSVFAMTISPLC
jgi:hypothetical protein